MTWLKLSDDFDDDCIVLSLPAKWTHVQGLLHVMRRETGGEVLRRHLKRIADVDEIDAATAELVARGFWETTESGWRIVHHMDKQRSPEKVRGDRKATTKRVEKWRAEQTAKAAGESADEARNAVRDEARNAVTDEARNAVTDEARNAVTDEARNAVTYEARNSATNAVSPGLGWSGLDGSSTTKSQPRSETTARARDNEIDGLVCGCGFLPAVEDGLCVECLERRDLDRTLRAVPDVEDPPDLGWGEGESS